VNCGLTNESLPTLPAIIERALKSAIACSCVSVAWLRPGFGTE
jgi:hypothetical protein